ncbi:MAG: DUF1003 domain-containing protein [Gammaproteobacteria bacterium]|nr:DUF1003 domain-containing protein [Gammaproteobacteria bacterium]
MNAPTEAGIVCPVCGGHNAPDAVFCANPACHKALGEFRYVQEEVARGASGLQRLAERVAAWVGHPHFVLVHLAVFALWSLVNSGTFGAALVFDGYPFGLLGIILAIEAVLITSLLLISTARADAYEHKRAELEYEANIASYRLLRRLDADLGALQERLHALENGAPAAREPDSGA